MHMEDDPVSQFLVLAALRFDEFKGEGQASHIDEAIDFDRNALELCPPGHEKRSDALNSLTIHLRARHKHLGTGRDLDEAITFGREALELQPEGHSDRIESLTNLAVDLFTRYHQFGAVLDLDEAILLNREALQLHPKGHPNHFQSLSSLAVRLSTRFNQTGASQDLDEAILIGREALCLLPTGHPDRSSALNNLAIHLSIRYQQLGAMRDLDEAIVLGREALTLRPKGHPSRSKSLNNHAIRLALRYGQFGGLEDLEEAIVLGREALELQQKGHPNRPSSLSNLAAHLSSRYQQLGVVRDLDEAVALNREALALRPKGRPDRTDSLNNLAARLFLRYERLGTLQDLEEGIVLSREGLEALPKGHHIRPLLLSNLAIHLSTRYKQLNTIQDLEEAIVLDREALELRPQGHPDRSWSLSNLAVRLSSRFDHLGAISDLEEAILLDIEALGLRPKRHPDRAQSLSNLAIHLSSRHNHLGCVHDVQVAAALDCEALELRPGGHPDHLLSLNSVALRIHSRYHQLGLMKDLDLAIIVEQEALDLSPQGHPARTLYLNNLAKLLHTRFTRSRDIKDQEALFKVYAELTSLSQVVFSADVSAAQAWIDAAEEFEHPTLLLAYDTAFRLLVQHLATLPSLPKHHVVLKKLASSIAVDAFSACLRSNAPARAVELLEQGRSVFWNQLARLHSPLHDVMASGSEGKELADKFTQLAEQARSAIRTPGDADQHERLWQINLELQQVVTDIRALPGLSRFLLPPLFSDLRCVACRGPVIIVNASKYSCDVLIIFIDRDPVHVPLQLKKAGARDLCGELRVLTDRAKKEDMSRPLAVFLRGLWDRIVGPIVNVLQATLSRGSRIWWCPTAEFSFLPLHAAGPFRPGQRKLSEIYVSSYTPNLSSLIRARQSDSSSSANQEKRFLAIGQAKATGKSAELRSVGAELENIGQLVNGLATFTRIEGEESSISRVVQELGRSEWVHLACHGIPNRKHPFESAFALYDGRFMIQRMIGCELQNPEFAYLSACHAVVGDEESPDEVIHLAAAMQFLGFKSVIGTMWAADDGETKNITSTFYKHVMDESGRLDHTRAAFALNKTMRSVNIPFDQRMLYIHIGV